MENNFQNASSDSQVWSENIAPVTRPKLTFVNRYMHISWAHNRVDRRTFFINIVFFEVIYAFLKKVPFISLLFLFFWSVQVTKRFHDFGKSGYWTLGVVLYRIVVIFGPIVYLMMASGEGISQISWISASMTWALYTAFNPILWILYWLAQLIPEIILCLIPGDKNVNQYGEVQEI